MHQRLCLTMGRYLPFATNVNYRQHSLVQLSTRVASHKEPLFHAGRTTLSWYVTYSPSGDTTVPTQKAELLANATYSNTVAMSIGRKFDLGQSPPLCQSV